MQDLRFSRQWRFKLCSGFWDSVVMFQDTLQHHYTALQPRKMFFEGALIMCSKCKKFWSYPYDDVIYSQFKDARCHRNHLDDDQEWFRCFEEAIILQTPAQLHKTFAFICALNRQQMYYSYMRDFVQIWQKIIDRVLRK